MYPTVLSAQRINAHYKASGRTLANVLPAAAFTSTANGLNLAVDGSTSTDSDGTVASYSWNYGDGSPAGTGAGATHTYAHAGNYPVTLTVTDDDGGTNNVANAVTVDQQRPGGGLHHHRRRPGALRQRLGFDRLGRHDRSTRGTSVTAHRPGPGATPTHTYAAAGTYPVTLTVTDNDGGTNATTAQVTVLAANVAPTAAFTSTPTNLRVAFDGTGSTGSGRHHRVVRVGLRRRRHRDRRHRVLHLRRRRLVPGDADGDGQPRRDQRDHPDGDRGGREQTADGGVHLIGGGPDGHRGCDR